MSRILSMSMLIACLPTKHLGVYMKSFKRVRAFQIELEFGSVGFWGEGKTGVPGEKPLRARERTKNKLNPQMASTPGVKPGPHWWEASALTTAPSLPPQKDLRVHWYRFRFLALTVGRSYLVRPVVNELCGWAPPLSVYRVLLPKEVVVEQSNSCFSNKL